MFVISGFGHKSRSCVQNDNPTNMINISGNYAENGAKVTPDMFGLPALRVNPYAERNTVGGNTVGMGYATPGPGQLSLGRGYAAMGGGGMAVAPSGYDAMARGEIVNTSGGGLRCLGQGGYGQYPLWLRCHGQGGNG